MKNFLFLLSSFWLVFIFSANGQRKPMPQQKPYQAKLAKVTIAKKITVFLPSDFTLMPDEGIASKYPAARKPLGVYTSPNGQVDFSVNEKPSTFSDKDLPLVKDIYKASIMRMFSEVQFIRQEIKPINKKNMIVFEFVSTVKDENPNSNKAPIKKYTIVQYYLKGQTVTIFTLNAPAQLKDSWQKTANEIMNSIKIS